MLRDLHKGWNQSSPSSWSVSRLERSEPKPEVELLEKKSESSRVSRSLGRIEFLLDSFLDFCSLSSSFSFSLAAASCFELCTPWEKNEFCPGTICNYDWYHLCDCHDDVFQKGDPLAQDCHFFLDIFCTLKKRKQSWKTNEFLSHCFYITLSSNSALCLVCFSLGCRLAIS